MGLKIFMVLCMVGMGKCIQLNYTKSDECHPTPNPDKVHYLIGYGSLINSESKNKTYPNTGINVPVQVNNFQRSWTARGYILNTLSTTYLGVDSLPGKHLNGVIFSVPNAEAVTKYDERERYYCRVKVPSENVLVLRGNISDNDTFPQDSDLTHAEFWIYATIPQFNKYPDGDYPIVQSYVDIFLSGCLQMERKYGLKGYADECMAQTVGWNYPWVNDRILPRRPFAYQPEAVGIDKLIGKSLADYPKRTYIERVYLLYRNLGSSNAVVGQLLTFSLCWLTIFSL